MLMANTDEIKAFILISFRTWINAPPWFLVQLGHSKMWEINNITCIVSPLANTPLINM